jgi:hypothetical protein
LVCDLCACNLLGETNSCLTRVLIPPLLSMVQKHLQRDSNQGQFFGIVSSVPVISSP